MKINLKFIILPLLAAVLYLALNYHFIFINSKVYWIKKTKWSLDETIVGVSKARSNESLLANKVLRNAGLGELLVSLGRMTEDQLSEIKAKYEE